MIYGFPLAPLTAPLTAPSVNASKNVLIASLLTSLSDEAIFTPVLVVLVSESILRPRTQELLNHVVTV
jgi:hypothetical protein